jgi:hypothetical protein
LVRDLTFTLLSIMNFINFLWTWIGGQVSCKLQGFLIEACYTVSITTLALISSERLKDVVKPFSARTSAPEGACQNLAASWVLSLVVASPLLHAYQVQMYNRSTYFCINIAFGELSRRQIYYSLRAVCFFLVHFIYMIYNAHTKTFQTFLSSIFPIIDFFPFFQWITEVRFSAQQCIWRSRTADLLQYSRRLFFPCSFDLYDLCPN